MENDEIFDLSEEYKLMEKEIYQGLMISQKFLEANNSYSTKINKNINIPCKIIIRDLPFTAEILVTEPIIAQQKNKILSVTIKNWPYLDWRKSISLLSGCYLLIDDLKYQFQIGYTKRIQNDLMIHNGWHEMQIRPYKEKNGEK